MFIYIKLEGYFVGFVINQKLHLHNIKTYKYFSSHTNIHTLLHIYSYRFHTYTSMEPLFFQISPSFVKYICHNNFYSHFFKHSPQTQNQNDLDLCDTRYDWHTRCQSLHCNKYKCSRRIQA
jgi:hypothetical protein